MAKLESKFERDTMKEIKAMFPGCIVMKNDSGYRQGIPDRLILFEDTWAVLEFKRSAHEDPRPNQPYYVQLMNGMSFASFIYPENKDEVLRGLQHAFQSRRKTRVP